MDDCWISGDGGAVPYVPLDHLESRTEIRESERFFLFLVNNNNNNFFKKLVSFQLVWLLF